MPKDCNVDLVEVLLQIEGSRRSGLGLKVHHGQGAGTSGLIVIAGIELTHNPSGCLPAGDKSKKCRIHVNVLGVTARPSGRLEWAERKSHQRIDMYQAALVTAKAPVVAGTIIYRVYLPEGDVTGGVGLPDVQYKGADAPPGAPSSGPPRRPVKGAHARSDQEMQRGRKAANLDRAPSSGGHSMATE